MSGKKLDPNLVNFATPRQAELIEAVNEAGGITPAARGLGLHRKTIQEAIRQAEDKMALATGRDGEDKPLYGGRVEKFSREVIPPPKKGVKRYILTSAQNNTNVHEEFWANLIAYKEFIGAKLLVSTFTYNHNAFGQLSVKAGTKKTQESLLYDPKVVPYISDGSIEIAPALIWCGEMNISPTAVNPLSGLATYTGRKSGIFPASKLDMKSVISGKSEPTKFNYTTGTVTQRNYIQKKAGLKAEEHHSFCALIVEVNRRGEWFVRQLQADEGGVFYDVPYLKENKGRGAIRAKDGKIETGLEVEAVTWGDLHAEVVDPVVREVAWGKDGMLDLLRPDKQFLHDTVDFRRRNHHDVRNPHKTFAKHIAGKEEVEGEIEVSAEVVKGIHRDWVETIIVDSNHDNAMMRWLREGDYRSDPVNALYFLECQTEVYRRLKAEDKDFHLIEWALQQKGVPPEVRFLRQDESYVILKDESGGIECGMHGDLGGNGARGTPNSLKRMGRRANTGHTHTCGIHDGLWVAGLTAQLDQGYNVGPGSWSHSQIIVFPNGGRSMVTIWNGQWRCQ